MTLKHTAYACRVLERVDVLRVITKQLYTWVSGRSDVARELFTFPLSSSNLMKR